MTVMATMTTDTRTLDLACRRYDAAEYGRIIHVHLDWPQLDDFYERLREYRRIAELQIVDDMLRRDLSRFYEIGRRLARDAVDPGRPDLGVADATHAADDGGILAAAREACVIAHAALVSSRHPAAGLAQILEDAGVRLPTADARIAVVARGRQHDAVRATINLPGRTYRLVTPTELKSSGMWDVAVYLGRQESAFSQVPIRRRRHEVAWMYSAPAAPVTVQVDWAFGSFDVADFSIWPEAPLTLSSSFGVRRLRVELPEDVTPPVVSLPPPTVGGVTATVFELPDGYRVAYGDKVGPPMWLVGADEYEVGLTSAWSSEVGIGDVIMVRLGRTAREYVRREARAAMGARAYDAAAALRDEFKAQVVDAARRPDAEALVRAQGLENAVYYFRVCEDPDYICVGTLETYDRLCRGLGLPRDPDRYRTIVSLRKYHRNAGHGARAVIESHLHRERGWEEELGETGVSRLALPEVGELLIGPVVAKSTTLRPVAVLGDVTRRGVPVG
jgi:hypothetical protein